MKSLTLLIFAVGCTTAFGQAMSTASNSNQYREYSANAVPIAYMNSSETSNSNASAVEQDFESISKQSDNPQSGNLSMTDIEAILQERIAMSGGRLDEVIDAKTEQ